MANPGGVGTKFLSVNLNKSYGQQNQHHHHHQHHNHHYNNQSHYGANRGSRAGGGGGGMVVLSRPRSGQKALPKLSVPPPLNLPSLRKEHERFDSLGSGNGSSGGGGAGSGTRPTSAGMGWTKPAAATLQEKEGEGLVGDYVNDGGGDQGLLHGVDGIGKGSSGVYVPPSARPGLAAPPVTSFPNVEKVSVLRGEDFPSLKAALPAVSGPAQKHKDGGNQKQKQVTNEEFSNEQRDSSHLSSFVEMRPQLQSSRHGIGNGSSDNFNQSKTSSGSYASEQVRKQEEYFPGLLPLVRLNPRSDWADDERDTGHVFSERSRDNGFSKTEANWDQDFDMPRPSVLPHKPVYNAFDRRGQRDNETGKSSSSEVNKMDPYGRDGRALSGEGREGHLWRGSPHVSKEGLGSQEVVNERNSVSSRPSVLNGEKENKHAGLSPFKETVQNDFGRRDLGYGQGGRQAWNNTVASVYRRGVERNTRERYGNEQYNRYRGDAPHNGSVSKSSFSMGTKGLPVSDPLLNFGREKRPFSKNEKPFVEDPFTKDFSATGFDPLSGGLVGFVKKKKDVQTDFHDPVRESFEAELERVQKMQEQERKRIMEEQERALEQARREEEERLRLVREQEERQRRLKEEAREAAWRADQERMDSLRKAEEQRIARDKEKQRILLEEERRKLAAKQKLLELEEKIAKRQAEAVKIGGNSFATADENVPGSSKAVDIGDWEDGERMVERITTSASSDSSGMNRSYPVAHFPRDGTSASLDRGKSVNSWRRDVFENGSSSTFPAQDLENGHHSPRQDSAIAGRVFPRKDLYGGGFMSSRPYYRGGMPEPTMDDFSHFKGQRWNISGDVEHYNESMDMESEFNENLAEKYGEIGWGQGRSWGNAYPPYPERQYPFSEADGLYPIGRLRYRQPRVLPPPSLSSIQKPSHRAENEHHIPSTFLENERQFNHAPRIGPALHRDYSSDHQENLGQHELLNIKQDNADNTTKKLDRNATPDCDSQSSLSVSSPPDSPNQLSHDDLDESGDTMVAGDVNVAEQQDESLGLLTESEKENMMPATSSVGDDEEWTIDNNEPLQQQEEYDEDEEAYQEEEAGHEGDDDHIDPTHEFEDMQLEDKGSPHMMDNLVLGFNEGVEVGMPNDEFEGSSRNEETTYHIPDISVGAGGEHVDFERTCSDGQNLQPENGPSTAGLDGSSKIFEETEKAMRDLAVQSNSTSQAPTDRVGHVDAGSSCALSIVHTESAAPNQSEVPLKLQFGLFSGPSLIPSPIPAIQIGSIQMPLHLHPPVGPSLTHMHPSQPPLFQFGQLRYTSPISQGLLPLATQSMSFVPPNVPVNFPLNQNPGVTLPVVPSQDTSSHNLVKNDHGPIQRNLDAPHGNMRREINSMPAGVGGSAESAIPLQQSRVDVPRIGDNKNWSESGIQAGKGHGTANNYKPEAHFQTGMASSYVVSKEKDPNPPKVHGLISGGRSKRYVFAVKPSGSRSSMSFSETSRTDSVGMQRRPRRQRTEFRVRENGDKSNSTGLVPSRISGSDDMSSDNRRAVANSTRNGARKIVGWNRQPNQTIESEGTGLPVSITDSDSGSGGRKGAGKESLTKGRNISPSREGNLKRNICSQEDVDASLQSGIVRVFVQPGIESPSDEGDFIQVRSKRQMLNDRREQREKEIRAKSRLHKMPRKLNVAGNSTKAFPSGGRSDFTAAERRGSLGKVDASVGFNNTMVSQPLAPIGTPAMNAQADMRSQPKSNPTSSLSAVSGGAKNLTSGMVFDGNSKVLDGVQTSLASWGTSRINQQVMALTQTQLDEAMKPAQFDSHTPVGDHTGSISASSMPSSSILTKNISLSSVASPVNSLLAGEKIQFGAVTSPTVLPPSARSVSLGIGPRGPSRSDLQISHNVPATGNDCTIFFDKEKQSNEPCVQLEDCEAEAAAAASAVAVAAISSDETVGSRLGTCPVSVADTKPYNGADIGDAAGDNQSTSHSRGGEESLSVALPADLSVETPPISLWPLLPSPQNSSNPMISHFPGGPPSHFPFYDMNPMLGGPIFAFGPHDESSSAQSESQKSNPPSSGPLGTWQPCHSGVDSFYGPPTGFTGPFISTPGGIPGVQGPPHMVVYNHFAPVGQFGQVGLSFMGTTYIPSGKQPDWKHNPVSSSMGAGEGDMKNINMVPAQRNPTNMPAPIQHLAPGSPLLPMASSLAMFDVSPFQPAPDMSVQARWTNPGPVQSVPMSMPLPQQAEVSLPSQFNHGTSADPSLIANRFPSESRTRPTSDSSLKFPVTTDSTVTQLPDELGLVDSSTFTGGGASQSTLARSSSASNVADAGKTASVPNSGNTRTGQNTNSAFIKPQSSQQRNVAPQQYCNSSGYQRGSGVSQKNNSGGEWSHRRMGFQGRNQSLGPEKGFGPSKMKQIYVAKQPSGTSTAS